MLSQIAAIGGAVFFTGAMIYAALEDARCFTIRNKLVLAVAGGWLLAFINSFDEVTLSIFVTSPATQTLPVRMYVYATESIDPMMAAVSALVIALTALTMILLDRVYGLDRVLVGKQ